MFLFSLPAFVCPLLDTPVNGQVSSSGQILGSMATYACHNGFRLKGPAVRFCQLHKDLVTDEQKLMWSGPQPSCNGKMFFFLLNIVLW